MRHGDGLKHRLVKAHDANQTKKSHAVFVLFVCCQAIHSVHSWLKTNQSMLLLSRVHRVQARSYLFLR